MKIDQILSDYPTIIRTYEGSTIIQDPYLSLKPLVEFCAKRKISLKGADLKGADLRGVDIRGINLEGARLDFSDFSNADLRGSILDDVSILFTNFEEADLSFSTMNDVECNGTNFRNASLYHANCCDSYFDKACLIGTNIEYCSSNSDLIVLKKRQHESLK